MGNQMKFNNIKAETSLGRGWARVYFSDCDYFSSLTSISIIRPRYQESFLGQYGWQVSESRIPLNITTESESDFSLLLSPPIVQYLEVNSNYKFSFFDISLVEISSIIFRWHGISYRSSGNEKSPIDVIKNTELISPEVHIVHIPIEKTENLVENKLDISKDSPGYLNSWDLNSDKKLIENEIEINSPSFKSDQQSILTLPLLDKRSYQRVKCLNSSCGAEILDNMKTCPFCNTPR